MTLPDPERCRQCGGKGRVLNSRKRRGFRRRVRYCAPCDHRWNSYESIVDPRELKFVPKRPPV